MLKRGLAVCLIMWLTYLPPARSEAVPPGCSSIDWQLTTTPAPPESWITWQVHAREVELAEGMARDANAVIIGDSIAHGWPEAMLAEILPARRVLNLGLGGDRTQNVLWRLSAPQIAALRPIDVIVLLGTNNVSAKDEACAIVGGLAAVVDKIAAVWHPHTVLLLAILPRSPTGLSFPARRTVNEELPLLVPSRPWLKVIDASPAIEGLDSAYMPDKLHLTPDGYQRVTQWILRNSK